MIYWLCLTFNDDDYYRGLLRELQTNAFVSIQILIDLWDVVPNSIIACLYKLKYAETIFTTLKVQNYHFAHKGDFLSLIFKNYYGFVFTWISWLRNLFPNLYIK